MHTSPFLQFLTTLRDRSLQVCVSRKELQLDGVALLDAQARVVSRGEEVVADLVACDHADLGVAGVQVEDVVERLEGFEHVLAGVRALDLHEDVRELDAHACDVALLDDDALRRVGRRFVVEVFVLFRQDARVDEHVRRAFDRHQREDDRFGGASDRVGEDVDFVRVLFDVADLVQQKLPCGLCRSEAPGRCARRSRCRAVPRSSR